MDIEVILFDWGGTLAQVVRQEESLRRGAEQAARMLCARWSDGAFERLLDEIKGMEKAAAAHPEFREGDFFTVLRRWASAFGGDADDGKLEAAVNAIGREWVGSLDPFPGAAEALRTLGRRGYRLGLVSNCMIPRAYCLEEFNRQGFEGLVSFHTISSAVGYRKPSPKIYEAALAEAYPQGRPADLSRVLFVGDSPVFDVAAPAALGMTTALVTCRKGLWSAEDYARAHPDLTIDSVVELTKRL